MQICRTCLGRALSAGEVIYGDEMHCIMLDLLLLLLAMEGLRTMLASAAPDQLMPCCQRFRIMSLQVAKLAVPVPTVVTAWSVPGASPPAPELSAGNWALCPMFCAWLQQWLGTV